MSETIQVVKIEDLHHFPDNPFIVQDNDELVALADSIRQYGVITPLILRPRNDGGYEIISGHRRVTACRKAGIEQVPAFIRDLDRDMAVISLVDSNLHREHILPSEKAFAYRMRLEAMKRQGYRSDRTCAQAEHRKKSVQILADLIADSRSQIQRYIRLTFLEKPLLDRVDQGRIALTPAMELSCLKPEEQNLLIQAIEQADATPSLSQAQRMRKLSEDGKLDAAAIVQILSEEKGNQKEVVRLRKERISQYFPANTTPSQMETIIINLLEQWQRQRERRIRDER